MMNYSLSYFYQRFMHTLRGKLLSSFSLMLAACILTSLWCFYEHASSDIARTMNLVEKHAMLHVFRFDAYSHQNSQRFSMATLEKQLNHIFSQYDWTGTINEGKALFFKQKKHHFSLIHTTSSFFKTFGLSLHKGRFFSSLDEHNNYFCVVGYDMYQALIQHTINPDEIVIDNQRYTIIGVLERYESIDQAMDINKSVYTLLSPIAHANSDLLEVSFHIPIHKSAHYHHIEDNIRSLYPKSHFHISDGIERARKFHTQLVQIGSIVAAMSTTIIIVCSISVINSLLVDMISRRKEIGIRLAVGAYPSDIIFMVFKEMVCQSIISSAVGSLVLATFSLRAFSYLMQAEYIISSHAYIFGLLSTFICAMFVTIYPAQQASKYGPVQLISESV